MWQYPHALHSQPELLENSYPQDGDEGSEWLGNLLPAEDNPRDTEPFVPGEAPAHDLWGMDTLLYSEATRFDPIDTGAPNGSAGKPRLNTFTL
jgi:hypothetical protein